MSLLAEYLTELIIIAITVFFGGLEKKKEPHRLIWTSLIAFILLYNF